MAAMTSKNAGKAIFVDGPWMNSARRKLGIPEVGYLALYDLLVTRVGQCKALARPPIVTVHPDRCAHGGGLVKRLAACGFEVLPADSHEGADDESICAHIRDLDPELIREIVVVTGDKDFVPVLRQKVTQGIRVFWVSTMLPDPSDNRCHFSEDVKRLCDCGVFTFVELGNYRSKIGLRRSPRECPRDDRPRHQVDNVTIIELRLKSNNPRAHVELADGIRRLQRQFPELLVNIRE